MKIKNTSTNTTRTSRMIYETATDRRFRCPKTIINSLRSYRFASTRSVSIAHTQYLRRRRFHERSFLRSTATYQIYFNICRDSCLFDNVHLAFQRTLICFDEQRSVVCCGFATSGETHVCERHIPSLLPDLARLLNFRPCAHYIRTHVARCCVLCQMRSRCETSGEKYATRCVLLNSRTLIF